MPLHPRLRQLLRRRGEASAGTIIGVTLVVIICLAVIGGSLYFIISQWSAAPDDKWQASAGPPEKPMPPNGGPGGPPGAPPQASAMPKVGDTAKNIEGNDTDGKSFKLSDYQGKVVVIDFWAGWCGPCMREVPHNKEIVKKFEGKPFAFLGVNLDRAVDEAKKTVQTNQINWRSWFDEGGKISNGWGVRAIPSTFILDKKGVIRHVGLRGGAIDTAVEALLKEEGDSGVKTE